MVLVWFWVFLLTLFSKFGFFVKIWCFWLFFMPKKWRCRLQKCNIWQMASWRQKKSDHPAGCQVHSHPWPVPERGRGRLHPRRRDQRPGQHGQVRGRHHQRPGDGGGPCRRLRQEHQEKVIMPSLIVSSHSWVFGREQNLACELRVKGR